MESYPNMDYPYPYEEGPVNPYPYEEGPVNGGEPEAGNRVGYVIKKSDGQVVEVEADSYELSDGEFRFRSGSRLVRTISAAEVAEVNEKVDQP